MNDAILFCDVCDASHPGHTDASCRPPAPAKRPSKEWIQTLQNRRLEPRALTVEAVGSIEEIAHSLAGEFRFTRQTQARYSVAEHCVRGSRLLPAVFAGAFLLHDCSETYLPDIAGPLKPFLFVDVPAPNDGNAHIRGYDQISWSELERQHTRVILTALGLASLEPLIYSPEVKRMDLAMLMAEKRDLCGPEPEPWGIDVEPATLERIKPWSPEIAEQRFLERFRELFT